MTHQQQQEDAEQAATLAAVVLPYHPRTHIVLRGPWQSFRVGDAREYEVRKLLDAYEQVRCRVIELRPWWRLWRRTPAIVLTPEVRR